MRLRVIHKAPIPLKMAGAQFHRLWDEPKKVPHHLPVDRSLPLTAVVVLRKGRRFASQHLSVQAKKYS